MVAKKAVNKHTSPAVATKASKQLRNSRSTPSQRAVAASDLTQAAAKKKPKKK